MQADVRMAGWSGKDMRAGCRQHNSADRDVLWTAGFPDAMQILKPICLPGCMVGAAESPCPVLDNLVALTTSPDPVLHKIDLGPHEVHQRSRVYKHPDTILLHKFIKLALALYMSGLGPWLLLVFMGGAAWGQHCPS